MNNKYERLANANRIVVKFLIQKKQYGLALRAARDTLRTFRYMRKNDRLKKQQAKIERRLLSQIAELERMESAVVRLIEFKNNK